MFAKVFSQTPIVQVSRNYLILIWIQIIIWIFLFTAIPMPALAAFAFKDYAFTKVEMNMGDYSDTSPLDLLFSPSGIYDKEAKTFILRFVFTANQGDESKAIVKIVCEATFEFRETLDLEAIPEYFYPNSLAIVFPYVRAFVSSVTLQANMTTPILIPTLNLTQLQSTLKAKTVLR